MIGKGIAYNSIVDSKIYSSFSRELHFPGEERQVFEFVVLSEEKNVLILWRCQYNKMKDSPQIIEVLDVFSIYDKDYALETATKL